MANWWSEVKRLRLLHRMTQRELAAASGLKRPHISRIECGDYQTATDETLRKLARGFGLTLPQLIMVIFGAEKPMVKESPELILERFRVSLPASVPIYGEYQVHAGEPVEAIDYLPITREEAANRRLEAYVVHGRCLEPEINDGDTLIVDRHGAVEVGDIVSCLLRSQLYVGRIRKINNELWLTNRDISTRLTDCQAIAPVIEVRRRLK